MEKQLQTKIIKFLKERGVYVIKTRPSPGTPTGCPDIIGLYGSRHTEIEVKASAQAPYRPGQELTLQYLQARGAEFVYTAYPENWEEVKADLVDRFF